MPWDFLGTVSAQAGIVAAILFAVLLLALTLTGLLLKANLDLTKKLTELKKPGGTEAAAVVHRCEAAHHAMETAMEKFREGIVEEARKSQAQVVVLASRVDELQELRVREGREDQQAMARYIASIDHNINKVGTTMDVMVELMRRGT